MTLAERGYRYLKFFPAEPAGGVPYLKALAAPLPGNPLLSDGRHRRCERRHLSGAPQCRLRRRLMGGAGRGGRGRRLEPA